MLRQRIAELECVCAESYQVVGALADSLGVFNDTKTIKALDNLSAQTLVHTDILPFSVEARTLTVKLPESVIDAICLTAAEIHNLGRGASDERAQEIINSIRCAAGITLVVEE